MKIKNLLMLAAFLTVSGGAMAQTTITAAENAKFVPDGNVELKYSYTSAEAMGGFQMVVSLPNHLTLEENAEKTAQGLSIGGGEVAKNAIFYNVTVPSGFECIGVKADVPGTTTDGTPYEAGDVLLVCFPVKAGASYAATTTKKDLCTLILKTDDQTTSDDLAAIQLNGFAGSDTNGTANKLIAAASGSIFAPTADKVRVLQYDINGDKKVDVTDLSLVIESIWDGDLNGDRNNSGETDITDLSNTIDEIW